ncbi:MAG TPA: cytochrome c oxidase assembly protein [Kiloniellales bacterium]|jgi:cytochrome c oxidase assembly protein subunit 11
MGTSRRNARTGLVLAGVAAGMVGLAFASVPLYRLFCQVTGFGGTTQVAEQAPAETIERTMVIRFNADVDPKLPWSFQPNQRQISLRVGEPALATYTARNLSDSPMTGTATFNVTPLKAGRYFDKVQCFCFDEQRLEAGQDVEMAVSFFVDPAIMDDRNLDEVKTITLSYTFFRAMDDTGGAADAAPRTMNQQSAAASGGPPASN